MNQSKNLRKSLIAASAALLIAVSACVVSTYAWYIYNTGAHTTTVQLAAGSSIKLQISSDNSNFGYSANMTATDKFVGVLNPVSTDNISNGFQKVKLFENVVKNGQNRFMASIFSDAEQYKDYFHTKLYLRTNASSMDIYISDISGTDKDETKPISTAVRVGLVMDGVQSVFELSDKNNPEALNNTKKGEDGEIFVLDSTKKDGSVNNTFRPYTSDNFCDYDKATGEVKLKNGSHKIGTITGSGSSDFGSSKAVDVYIWLEGCDKDCVINLLGATLENLSISFAGVSTDT
ncbi:MAG: hypothetical protein PUC98_05630 [Clostridiales bacterium]|nr:hypothetical protein [Clostridiales bacterium]